jgi:AcrR family transcriptional regulator
MGRPPTITRDDLLAAARRVFGAKGYDGATLADIAGELKVTPAAVLRHFPSKLALFGAAMRDGRISPPDFILALKTVDAATDPRLVLRNLAEKFIRFAETTLAESLAVYGARGSIVLPFDPNDEANNPPRRGLAIVTDYFRRAAEAGVVRVREPRAAALLFMGSLQSYVMLHRVFHVAPKPYPLADYIHALLDLWTYGAIGGTRAKRPQTASTDRAAARARSGRPRHARVVATAERAEGDRPLRNARSANRRSGVAHRRPRRPRPRR